VYRGEEYFLAFLIIAIQQRDGAQVLAFE
jgi:hypothetical protein